MSNKNWIGVEPEKLAEIANRYEAACLIAAQRARELEKDYVKFAERFAKLRDGIWVAVAQELRDLGCPEEGVPGELANVINFAVRRRVLRGIPVKGHA